MTKEACDVLGRMVQLHSQEAQLAPDRAGRTFAIPPHTRKKKYLESISGCGDRDTLQFHYMYTHTYIYFFIKKLCPLVNSRGLYMTKPFRNRTSTASGMGLSN